MPQVFRGKGNPVLKSTGGNYIQWSVTQLLAGAVCAGLTLMKVSLFPTLGASFLVMAAYKVLYKWEHIATETEMRNMLRVFSLSSLATLAVLTIVHGRLGERWISVLWAVALASRGFFGLFVFARGTGGSGAETGKGNSP